MDREQEEMQFLGIFGIYKEAYKLIFTFRKIFTQITLTLILPLSFIFLAHMEVSNLLFTKIIHTDHQLDRTQKGTAKYNKLSHLMSSERTYFWLFEALYLTFFLIFSLISTAAVVYTIACIYTSKEITFTKVLTVVPKVWKRLMITFLCSFLAFFIYNAVSITIAVIFFILTENTDAGVLILFLLLIAYFVGSVYLTILWHLASVISVLEDSSGFKAVVKSYGLIKGKWWVAVVIFLKLNVSLFIIERTFRVLVVSGRNLGMVNRVSYGITCLLLLFSLFLFGLVVQTIVYFVCKSYHHENIDKSALSDHLQVYDWGEYVPLKAKDVQLEQYDRV